MKLLLLLILSALIAILVNLYTPKPVARHQPPAPYKYKSFYTMDQFIADQQLHEAQFNDRH